MSSDVHCQIDVQLGKVGDYLQLVVAFLVAHQIEVVVILFQYGYRLWQQHYRIGHTGFQTLVAYAVVLALPEHVRLLDLHKVGVRQPRVAIENYQCNQQRNTANKRQCVVIQQYCVVLHN